MSSRDHFDSLTGMRGISALMVILTHCVSSGEKEFSISPGLDVGGNKSVYFFFALSGFLLMYRAFCEILPASQPKPASSSLTSLDAPKQRIVMPTKISIISYLFRRLFRIYPAYLVVLLMSEDRSYPHITKRFWRRLFMLPTSYAHLWTVRVELCYYLILPLFQILCAVGFKIEAEQKTKRRFPITFGFLAFITGFAIWVNCIGHVYLPSTAKFWEHFPVFWYGTLSGIIYFYLKRNGYVLNKPKTRIQKFMFYAVEITTYLIMIIIVLTSPTSSRAFIGRETALSRASEVSITPLYCLLLLLLTVTDGETSLGKFFTCNFFTWTGKASYSIYLVQYAPIKIILNTSVRGFEAVLAVIVITCILGWILHTVVEEPGVKVGNYLIRKIKGAPKKKEQAKQQHQQVKQADEQDDTTQPTKTTVDSKINAC